MTKRKRFGISSDLNKGFSETINAVTDHAGQVRFEIISLERIETDPENPRELAINPEEILRGLNNREDPEYKIKTEEYEKLSLLADTITKNGLINPVVVYKYGEKYRLVAGERRYLASLIAGKRNIQARILNEKPKNVNLRLLQWVENNEREDLSLKDRIGNLESIIKEYKQENPAVEITATLIKDLISISLPQSTYYLAIMNAPSDVKNEVTAGRLNNLDKAAVLSKVKSEVVRKIALDACLNGYSLKQLKNLIEMEINLLENKTVIKTKNHRINSSSLIDLGKTKSLIVIKKIATAVLEHPEYHKYTKAFAPIDWNERKQAIAAFQKLVQLFEMESE